MIEGMTARRRLLSSLSGAVLATLLAGGCLFPSFAQFEENGPKRDGGSSKRDTGEEEEEDEKDGSVSVPDTGSNPPVDSGVDANRERIIRCGPGGNCTVGPQFCCIGVLPAACEPVNQIDGCVVAVRALCDGNEDCTGANEQCCFIPGNSDVRCRVGCPGTVVCSGTGQCATGTCTRQLDGELRGCQ
jgi:hypothetical protein